MKPLKSAVTFFRKQLGFRGASQHNGRGVFEMDITDAVTKEDIELKLRQCIDKWHDKDIIQSVTEDDRFLSVILKDSIFQPGPWTEYTKTNQSYRQLSFNKQYGCLGVCMVFEAFGS